jgi:hypothetical protein
MKWLVTISVGFIIVVIVAANNSAPPRDTRETRPPQDNDSLVIADAVSACKRAVTPRLKSPSTAEYPPLHRWEVRVNEAKTIYATIAYVDAHNSFGAMLRTEVGCQLSRNGNIFTVTNVIIDE